MFSIILRIPLLILLILLMAQSNLSSQVWKKINLEYGYITTLRTLESSPNTILLGINAFPTDFTKSNISFNNFGQGLIISNDGGKTWSEPYLDGFTVLDLAQSPDDPNLLFASVTQLNRGGIIKSTDAGKSWGENKFCEAQYKIMEIAPKKNKSGEFYASAVEIRDFIYTNDYFNKCSNLKNFDIQSRSIAISKLNPDYIFIASDGLYESGVIYTTDGGKSWKKSEKGLENKRVHTILASSHRVGLLYVGCDSIDIFKKVHGKGIYRSEDTGRTWHPVIANGAIVWDIAEHPRYPKFIAAACGNQGVYVSANLGAYWEQFKNGLPENSEVNKILIPDWDTTASGFTAFAAVYGEGLFITDGLNTSIDYVYPPDEIEIQIQPMPIKSQMNLLINSPVNARLGIEIVNMLGKQVLKYPELTVTIGSNSFQIEDIKDLPAGAYLLILKSDKFLKSQVIMKN